MAVPDDYDTVMETMRLGWYIAEVRGRNEGRSQLPGGEKRPKRTHHALPLRMERSPNELRIEAQAVLSAVAGKLKVDADDTHSSHFSVEVNSEAKSLAEAAETPGAVSGQMSTDPAVVESAATTAAGAAAGCDLDSLEDLIYRFDAHIQDTLAAQSETVACGYQLGRALAECYWALNPDEAEGWASWSFLLGHERCGEIGRLLGRLSAYFHPYTAAAIAGSVKVWESVAATPDWRAEADTYPSLYQQIRRWYELILLKQDPTTLIQPYQMLKDFRLVWRAARLFWVQLVLAALAAAALAGFAYLLATPGGNSAATTVLGGLGITGFSVAGLASKAKNDAQAMLTRVKQDAYTDLIAVAITTAPLPPTPAPPAKSGAFASSREAFASAKQEAKMTSIVQERSLTPVTPN